MDLENDKEDTIEVMNAVLRNDLAVDDKKVSEITRLTSLIIIILNEFSK